MTDTELQTLLDSDLPVMVRWRDAFGEGDRSWYTQQDLDELLGKFNTSETRSVGILAGYNDICLLLTMGCDGEKFHTPFLIPRSWTLSIQQLTSKGVTP